MPGVYQDGGSEPPIEDLLADPIFTLLLERDRIDPADLQGFLAQVRERLQGGDAGAADRPQAA